MMRKLIVTGLGTGYLPVAPGTWGCLPVVGLFLLLHYATGGDWRFVGGPVALLAALSAVACVKLGRFTEQAFGKKDPGKCVIDEWAGQAITFLHLPLGTSFTDGLVVAASAFVAFRVFDIVKPPPARQLEALPHGWGVLLDDVFAGIYANLACQLFLRLGLGF